MKVAGAAKVSRNTQRTLAYNLVRDSKRDVECKLACYYFVQDLLSPTHFSTLALFLKAYLRLLPPRLGRTSSKVPSM